MDHRWGLVTKRFAGLNWCGSPGRRRMIWDEGISVRGQLAIAAMQIMKSTFFYAVTLLSLWACLALRPLVLVAAAQSDRSEPNQSAPGIDIKHLCQHWVHSSEEEKTGGAVQVFRPAGSREFPPSRFRMAYKFDRNGDCEWLFLSPDDAHHFKSGKWVMDARDQTLLKITANGKTKSYRIAELTESIMRLKPLTSEANK
jgi:hypothetical protein